METVKRFEYDKDSVYVRLLELADDYDTFHEYNFTGKNLQSVYISFGSHIRPAVDLLIKLIKENQFLPLNNHQPIQVPWYNSLIDLRILLYQAEHSQEVKNLFENDKYFENINNYLPVIDLYIFLLYQHGLYIPKENVNKEEDLEFWPKEAFQRNYWKHEIFKNINLLQSLINIPYYTKLYRLYDGDEDKLFNKFFQSVKQ